MAISCLNKTDKDVQKLINKFGEVTVSSIVSKYYPDSDFTYNSFMSNSDILNELGYLSSKEVKEELGKSLPKTISSDQAIGLKKLISDKNNKTKGTVYMVDISRIGESNSYTWKVRKVKGNLDRLAKLERAEATQKNTVASQDNKKNLEKLAEGSQLSLFNLNKADKSRKKINSSLNSVLKTALSKITVDIAGNRKTIVPKTIEEYKNIWANRPENKGKPMIEALGVADLLDGIYAYSEDDGITLPEEAIHFILYLIKDTPEVKELLNLKDNDGIRYLQKTTVYQDNYRTYLDHYDGDVNKTNLEILGKLISQYMYDTRREKSVTNKFYKLIDSILKFFRSKLRFQYKIDEYHYPVELRKALGIIDKNITSFEYFKDESKNVITSPYSKLNAFISTPSDSLKRIANTLEAAISEAKQVLYQMENTGTEYNIFKELYNKLGFAEDEYSSPMDLTTKQLQDRIADVNNKLVINPTLIELRVELQNLRRLEKLKAVFDESSEQTRTIRTLESRLKYLNNAIIQKQYEEGLNLFIFGLGNMKDKEYQDYNVNEYGAVFDLFRAATMASKYMKTPELVRVEHIARVAKLLQLYKPIIDLIKDYRNNNDGKLFEKDATREARVTEALSNIDKYIEVLDKFMGDKKIHYNAKRNIMVAETSASTVEVNEIISEEDSKEFTEISAFNLQTGGFQHVTDNWLKVFQKKLLNLQNNIKKVTSNEFTGFYQKLVSLGYDKLSPAEISRIFYLKDKNGNLTHYLNTKYDVNEWYKNRKEYEKQIVAQLKNIVKNSTVPEINQIYIPDRYEDLSKVFQPIYNLSKDTTDFKNLPEDIKAIWYIRDRFSEMWGKWEADNSQQLPENEINAIINQRKKEMNLYRFNQWEAANKGSYVTSDGKEVTYYKGELTTPSDKYLNKQYSSLSFEHKALADFMLKHNTEQKRKLGLDKYGYEFYARLPQITSSKVDMLFNRKGFIANVKDKIKDKFLMREDDDMTHRDEFNNIIRVPPIRYNRRVEDPKTLTTDIVRSMGTYMFMVENRNQMISNLPELQGMIDMVEKGRVRANKDLLFEKNKEHLVGKTSNLYKAMNHLLESIVFGDETKTFNSTRGLTKIAKTMYKHVQGLSLKGSFGSAITSFISSEIDKIVHALVGDSLSLSEVQYGQKEFLRNSLSIMADFELPIKKNKFSILAMEMVISDSLASRMELTNINRGLRAAGAVIAPFSLWAVTELVTSMPLIAAIASQIRKVGDKWYTVEQYKVLVEKNQANMKDWNSATNIMDYMDVKDGVIDFKDIPEYMIDHFYNKTQSMVSIVSQKSLDVDKGLIYRGALSQFLTMFLTWLYQLIFKSTKSRNYNWLNNRWEEGYYRLSTLRYGWNILKSLIGLDKTSLKSLLSPVYIKDEARLRNVYRLGIQMSTVAILSAIAYALVGLSLEDEDEDEKIDNLLLQMATLLSVKVMQEQAAKLSLADMYEFIQNPLANFDRTFSIFSYLDAVLELLNPEEEEEKESTVRRSIYDGMPKWQKIAITNTPYVKGLFESYYGAFINQAITKRDISQAVAYNQKVKGYRLYVLEKQKQEGQLARKAIEVFALPSRIIGYSTGEGILRLAGANYPESSSQVTLPSKKANEE
jgi:hypothetical protein